MYPVDPEMYLDCMSCSFQFLLAVTICLIEVVIWNLRFYMFTVAGWLAIKVLNENNFSSPIFCCFYAIM